MLSTTFFEPLALSYIIAMVASTVVALTVTPAMCYILLGNRPITERESPWVPWLNRIYMAVLSRAVRSSRLTYAVSLAVVMAGLGVYPFLFIWVGDRLGKTLIRSALFPLIRRMAVWSV